MATRPGYIDILGILHPNVNAGLIGTDTQYEQIVWYGGTPLPSKATLDSEVITAGQVQMWNAIKDERNRRWAAGVKVGNYWYHSDSISRNQQQSFQLLGSLSLLAVQWKTMSGAYVTMNYLLASTITQAILMSDTAIFNRANNHRSAMMASSTPWTYDFSAGWPMTYAEAKAAGLTA